MSRLAPHSDAAALAEAALRAAQFLLAMGYVVEFPGRWETPRQWRRRTGMPARTFRYRLGRPGMPQVRLERGVKRLLRIQSTAVFDEWMLAGWKERN